MLKGLIEYLRGKPTAVSLVVGVILIVLMVVVLSTGSGHSSSAAAPSGGFKMYYSDDDGKTWFLDDVNRIPPYTGPRGKEAYRAVLYRCPDGKPFVSRLEGYDGATQKAMNELLAKSPKAVEDRPFMGGMKVKRPGDKQWVTFKPGANSDRFNKIMTPVCPDGSANVALVPPEENVRPPG